MSLSSNPSLDNNINKRLKQTETNIKNNINKKKKNNNSSLFDKFTNLTTNFKNVFKKEESNKKIRKKILNNSNEATKDKTAFDNIYVLIGIFCITVFFISYGIYLYLKKDSKIKIGKTFYSKDLTAYKPLFKLDTDKIDKCIERCSKDVMCSGITFNEELLNCVGTKKGVLRNDTNNYKSWVKSKVKEKTGKFNTLIGLINFKTIIDKKDVPLPINPNSFNYSFYLYINDFYADHGKWRHIFHKGSEINEINTQDWENVIKMCPDQGIGVWLSPFNNNIRVCMTTKTSNFDQEYKSYKKPFIMKYNSYDYNKEGDYDTNINELYITDKSSGKYADNYMYSSQKRRLNNKNKIIYEKNMEFVDIYNVPIKKLTHFSINLLNKNMNIYINGKLHKSFVLSGNPMINDGHLYAKYNKTFDGNILDLKFSPTTTSLIEIINTMSNKSDINKQYTKK